MTMQFAQAEAIAQQFLGDLGVLVPSESGLGSATDEAFVFRFRTAAQALDSDTVLLVDRTTGEARFVGVRAQRPA
jgi:hypothetical protein